MDNTYFCRYCGEKRSFDDRDYDLGLYLAEQASFAALGHCEMVTPYMICTKCAEKIRQNLKK